MKLLSSVSLEKIVVRERLQTGGLSDRQGAALLRIGMDEVVSILGNMAGNGSCRFFETLNPEPVGKVP